MTLNTNIRIEGAASHREVFDASVAAIMHAANRENEIDSALIEYAHAGEGSHRVDTMVGNDGSYTSAKRDWTNHTAQWGTVIGQGLPGIVWVEDEDDHYMLSYDTGYGYREGGLGCTELHVSALVHLTHLLPKGTSVVEWENEYTGEWNKTVGGAIGPGVPEFLNGGDDAMEWFARIIPAIMSEMDNVSNE